MTLYSQNNIRYIRIVAFDLENTTFIVEFVHISMYIVRKYGFWF